MKLKALENINNDIEKIVDIAENRLSDVIEGSSIEAPVLENFNQAEECKWYRKNIENGKSGDGSEYHIYVKRGKDFINGPLCIFFSGGGVAWDDNMADNPVTSGKIAAGLPNYYWNNLRPVTQLMNIGFGLTDTNSKRNPFYNWNFVVITYSTGDMHIGNKEHEYASSEGDDKILYFNGYNNYSLSMEICKEYFANPEKILIAGDSAGGFAVAALGDEICSKWYPNCADITMFSDSSQLENKEWGNIVSRVWNSPDEICKAVNSSNPVVDWYRVLKDKYKDRIRILYAGSKHDYLLSSFKNDVENGEYKTDKEIQAGYEKSFRIMLRQLKQIDSGIGIYVYNWHNKVHSGGGTIHTAVRTPYFYLSTKSGISMKNWLYNAVNGEVSDVRYRPKKTVENSNMRD